MKILHVITSLRVGGAEKLMVDILPRMRAAGHDVELLCIYGEKTPFSESLEAAGITVHSLGMWGNMYHPLYLWRMFRFLNKNRYDVIHTHNYAAQLYCAICKFFGSVMLCTTEHTTSNRRRAWKWYAAIDRLMYSRYSRIICVSEKAEANLRNRIKDTSSRISTIPNGIDVGKIASAIPSKLTNLGEGKSNTKILMMVSRFYKSKDQDAIIRALKLLPDNFHAVFVGDGERRIPCEALAEELGVRPRTHFLGVRTDVAQLLKSADIVVMSSHWEGFCLAAAEGMAAGKPVVASDIEGMGGVVRGAGILFPESDEKSLAEAILKLATDADFYAKTAAACARRAEDFDIGKTVAGYLAVYESALSSK
ncbi:MAG: glycosyltransferase [Opitutae bacterium]|nr:glycosyltransferase [Opitutae bacterium]